MEEEIKSRIYIEFDGPNSTIFHMKAENVSILQLAILATSFESKVRFMLTQEEIAQAQQAEMNRIAVPKPHIEVGKK